MRSYEGQLHRSRGWDLNAVNSVLELIDTLEVGIIFKARKMRTWVSEYALENIL